MDLGQQFTRPSLFDPKPYFPSGKGQGKMFADPKPTDEHRYQRGYTPERMREIQSAPIEVHPSGMTGHFEGSGGAHRVLQTIARSTTPVTDFTESTKFHPQSEDWGDRQGDDAYPLRIDTAVHGNISGVRGMGAAATYQRGGAYERGRIQIAANAHESEERAGQSLMHELGHYKSAKVEHNPSAAYETPTMRGKEEAVADQNEVDRWRPDPRDVRRGISDPKAGGVYESRAAHQGIGGKVSHAAYVKARNLPSEKKAEILKQGWNPHFSEPASFVDEHTGDAWSHAGPRSTMGQQWNVQGALFNPATRSNGGEGIGRHSVAPRYPKVRL